jgi:hypothetical protein
MFLRRNLELRVKSSKASVIRPSQRQMQDN